MLKTEVLQLRIAPDLKRRLAEQCGARGVAVSAQLVKLAETWLADIGEALPAPVEEAPAVIRWKRPPGRPRAPRPDALKAHFDRTSLPSLDSVSLEEAAKIGGMDLTATGNEAAIRNILALLGFAEWFRPMPEGESERHWFKADPNSVNV